MVYLDEFEENVLEQFGDLFNKEGFLIHEWEKTQHMYYVYFKKKGMWICVDYSLKNAYIDVMVFRDPEIHGIRPLNMSETTDLAILMIHNGLDISDYNEMMPSRIKLEDSLASLKEKFLQFGMKTIRGQEWFSADDLRRQRNPYSAF